MMGGMNKGEEIKKKAEFDNHEKVIEGGVGPDGNYISADKEVTVGFEIEFGKAITFKDNQEKEYAARITKSKIYDLATKLGVEDFNKDEKGWSEKDRETAFAYLIDNEGNKILGLYLDTPPELEFDNEEWSSNDKVMIPYHGYIEVLTDNARPFEIKSVSPSCLIPPRSS